MNQIINGDMLEELDKMYENTIDVIITDPPYELNFMGKGWDNAGVSFNKETWEKCLRVLKPGGYLLAFGGSRTFHRIACAIEDGGFEIRDTIMWLYGSGFPKSMNVGLAIDKKNGVESKVVGYQGSMMDFRDTGKKQKEISGIDKLSFGQIENSERKENPIYEAQNEWKGWGTALKPSFEPIIIARKPFKGSLVDNVLQWGVGGLNIDECRVGTNEQIEKGRNGRNNKSTFQASETNVNQREYQNSGRFPANTILTYDQITFDEVCGGFPNTKSGSISKEYKQNSRFNIAETGKGGNLDFSNCYGDSDSASRYFYCAKASKKDRDEGLEEFDEKLPACVTDFRPTLATNPENWNNGNPVDNPMMRTAPRKNIHPTVKPTELMQYLVRLVSPKGATILDPFMGSGSTGKAVAYENKERNANYNFIGIELSQEYCDIAEARIKFIEE